MDNDHAVSSSSLSSVICLILKTQEGAYLLSALMTCQQKNNKKLTTIPCHTDCIFDLI